MTAKLDNDQLACIYSALILVDDDVPITTDKIKAILKAADVDVEPIWPGLFARALSGCDVKELMAKLGGPAAGGAPVAAASAATEKAEEKPAAAAVEESSDEDDDMGLGLFDD